jgi:exosortase B
VSAVRAPAAPIDLLRSPWLLVMAGLAAMYLPSYWQAAHTIWQKDELGHAPIILVVALWLFWSVREQLLSSESQPSHRWGWPLLGFGLLAYVFGRIFTVSSVEFASQVFVVSGAILLLKGVGGLRAAWFAVFYLAFMVPLPATFVDAVTGPLKLWISNIVVELLYLVGYPIARTGVVITIGQYQLLVADACSGLNSMFSLTALGTLFMFIMARRSRLHNAVMLLSILPIAFAANIVRVVTLVLITYHAGDEAGQRCRHCPDAGGAGAFLCAGRCSLADPARRRLDHADLAMPTHLRALVVIMVLSSIVFWIARKPICAQLMKPEDFARRRNLWLIGTLIIFLSHDFWIFAGLWGLVLLLYGRRDPNPIALYVMLLLGMPGVAQDIPGFGLVNHLFELSSARLATLTLLLPAAWMLLLHGQPDRHWRTPDTLVLAFLAYNAAMQANYLSLTMTMRGIFGLFIDIWLPYYVASRTLRDTRSLLEVAAAFVLGLAVLAPMAVFEGMRHWLLYSSLTDALSLPPREINNYLIRGDTGLLRAMATTGHSIILGYVMMIGIAMLLVVMPRLRPRSLGLLCTLTIIAGLVATLSRGPWVGAAVALLVGMAMGDGAARRWAWAAGSLAVIGLVLVLSPLGEVIIEFLPFVGSVDAQNVSYRQRLFEISMIVLWDNPVFGSFSYMVNPLMEQLRQGQGIIDMVNTYLAIALTFGLVGLGLFVVPFVHTWIMCWSVQRRAAEHDPDAVALGRSLLAALAGVAVTIATVSNIGLVPRMYWLLLGVTVAYVNVLRAQRVARSGHVVSHAEAAWSHRGVRG